MTRHRVVCERVSEPLETDSLVQSGTYVAHRIFVGVFLVKRRVRVENFVYVTQRVHQMTEKVASLGDGVRDEFRRVGRRQNARFGGRPWCGAALPSCRRERVGDGKAIVCTLSLP
jgi:hypothetical protein